MSDFWKDIYNKEVLGLNASGDPIGGGKPIGLHYQVVHQGKVIEHLNASVENLNSQLVELKLKIEELESCKMPKDTYSEFVEGTTLPLHAFRGY